LVLEFVTIQSSILATSHSHFFANKVSISETLFATSLSLSVANHSNSFFKSAIFVVYSSTLDLLLSISLLILSKADLKLAFSSSADFCALVFQPHQLAQVLIQL
jgi:hypothetical protein